MSSPTTYEERAIVTSNAQHDEGSALVTGANQSGTPELPLGSTLPPAPAGEQLGPAPAESLTLRTSEAEVTRVSGILHDQADRLMVDAVRATERAFETRATAAQHDRQTDDLQWRAERLHAQAEHLRTTVKG